MKYLVVLFTLIMCLKTAVAHDAEICTLPLPVLESSDANKLLLGLRHVYLKVGGKTYGMPYTKKQTYFGGDAYLYTDDPYFIEDPRNEECIPVQKKDLKFSRRIKCIADKLSVPYDGKIPSDRTWYPIFDYHALKNNCASMTEFLVECAGGKVSTSFNFSVGDDVPLTKKAKVASLQLKWMEAETTYGALCERAVNECKAEGEFF